VAVAATVGVGVMIRSFRATVVDWLGTTLQADVYLSPPGLVFRRGGGLIEPALAREIAALPGVAAADSVRVRTLDTARGQVDLFATTLAGPRPRIYRFKAGDPEAAVAAVRRGAVLVSEPFAYRFDVAVGDTLRLPTDRGEAAFPIAAVYYDYGSDLGVVVMDDAVFRRHYAARGLTGLALYAAPGVAPDDLVARARAVAAGRQALQVRSNRALRETSIALFDRTFLVTAVLRLLAVGVAFVGVLSALMALQLERQRELAVLRAQGMTTAEVGRLVTLQTTLMGLWAGLLAVPLGLLLAAVLVYVVNRRSFGWTLAFQPAPDLWVQAALLALAAAVLAGLYPARAARRADPALALREEG
jgi:putative ABC transport system permease protein